ncbi:MAG: nuclear transport factor 2 family protein [Rhizobacter sp.]|nr:nuclear transport factor 2 family protein [Chlorobiales bacterium]
MTNRDQIIETVNGVFMYADSREWSKCEVCFIDAPTVDYRSFAGTKEKLKSADLMKRWSNFLPKFTFTQHFISNHRVVIAGEKATVFCYGHAIHYLAGAAEGDLWGVYGTYNFELVRTPAVGGGWKVSAMTFNFTYQDGNKNLPALVSPKK